MPARKYTDAQIKQFAARDYTSLDKYQQRLVRGFNRGLSRTQAVGHAHKAKEKPISKLATKPALAKGTGKVTSTPALPKSKRKSYGRSVMKIGMEGKGRRINAASMGSVEKRLASSKGDAKLPVLYVVNARTGQEVRAVSKGQTVGDFNRSIQKFQSQGMGYKEALTAAIQENYSLYQGTSSDTVEEIPDDITNVIMYTQ
jgi:hypothetical protein